MPQRTTLLNFRSRSRSRRANAFASMAAAARRRARLNAVARAARAEHDRRVRVNRSAVRFPRLVRRVRVRSVRPRGIAYVGSSF